MVKKCLAFILCLSLLLSLCSMSLADEPVTLRLWAGIQPEYGYDELVKKFNEQFADKGVQVEYVRYMNNADGNLQLDTYLMSGGEIDVFVGYGGLSRLLPRQSAGLVLDLTDLLTAKGFDPVAELGATNLTTSTINGRYYAMPTKYENNQWMFINKNMFEAAGIEIPYAGWTYNQFREAAQKLTTGEGADKVYGMYWCMSYDMKMILTYMNSYLGDFSIYKDMDCTQTNFDAPIYEQSLQLLLDTMLTDKTAPTYGEEVANSMTFANTFLEGRCAMSMGIANIRLVKDMETYPHDFTTALVPMPVPDESYLAQYADHGDVSTGIGDTICISAKTEHVDEAIDFMIWYIKGGMAPLAKGGRLPLWSGVNSQSVADALMSGNENVFDKQSVLNYLNIDKSKINVTPDRPLYALSEINTVATEELENAMLGTKDAKTALADMKTRSDELIKAAMAAK